MTARFRIPLFVLFLAAGAVVPAVAQDEDPDRDPNRAQPDFVVSTVPTTLRLPKGAIVFRLTHRFARPLGQGSFGSLLEDFFGFDSGAQMGFDLRYGLFSGTQVGFYRTSDRTIQFSAQYDLVSQKQAPIGVAVVANVDGTNNFKDSYSPGVQAVISRELGDRGAVYAAPAFINNTNDRPTELVDDNNTALVGLGARLRVLNNTYVTFEATPRVTGYAPGVTLISFGFEQRAGGHSFQINFSNGFGTTLAQVARGGTAYEDWYIGFNLSRKFY